MRYAKTKVTVDGFSLSGILVTPTYRILPKKYFTVAYPNE